jgi:hypothetical protein
VCWAVATAPPGKGGKGRKTDGRSLPDGAEMMSEQIAAAPAEVSRWWRQVAAGSGSGAPMDGSVVDGHGMESVVRLLCHIDETWFRLHYFACTEAPTVLSATLGGAGVPRYSEWMQRAVGATLSSAWVGGVTGGRKRLEAQASALESAASEDASQQQRGWSVDLDGREAAAVLRRGCAAAVDGAAALSHPPRKIGIPAAKVGNASGKEGSGVNELLQIYDCMVVETQLLFQHHTQLAQLSKAQWSGLTTSTGSCPGVASTQLLASGLCVACAAPTTTSSSGGQKKRKKSQQLSRAITCCFCGGKACASSCIVTCIGCSEAVCIRCASAALAPPATNF